GGMGGVQRLLDFVVDVGDARCAVDVPIVVERSIVRAGVIALVIDVELAVLIGAGGVDVIRDALGDFLTKIRFCLISLSLGERGIDGLIEQAGVGSVGDPRRLL